MSPDFEVLLLGSFGEYRSLTLCWCSSFREIRCNSRLSVAVAPVPVTTVSPMCLLWWCDFCCPCSLCDVRRPCLQCDFCCSCARCDFCCLVFVIGSRCLAFDFQAWLWTGHGRRSTSFARHIRPGRQRGKLNSLNAHASFRT